MKKTISLVTIIGLLVMANYVIFEPEFIKAAATSTAITVTQEVSQEITITQPSNVTMSAAIPGITGNPGSPRTGSATWNVKTNNSTGFTLAIKASTAPAMQLNATNTFSDYTPAVASTPDFDWSSPAASAAEFGYTVEASTTADTAQLFKDNGSACATGTANAVSKCWHNASTTDVTGVDRGTNTGSGGEDTIVRFQTESNAKYLQEGNYVATITATATEKP